MFSNKSAIYAFMVIVCSSLLGLPWWIQQTNYGIKSSVLQNVMKGIGRSNRYTIPTVKKRHFENLIYYGSNKNLSNMFNNEATMKRYSRNGNYSLMKRFPQSICIGTAKSGTHAILTFLNFHPKMACYIGEPDFFVSDDKSQRFYEKYLVKMPYSTKEQLTFEKTPQYLEWRGEVVAPRIHYFDPDIKLLVTVRNPIDRAYSYYYHFKTPRTPPFEVSHHNSENGIFFKDWTRCGSVYIKSPIKILT